MNTIGTIILSFMLYTNSTGVIQLTSQHNTMEECIKFIGSADSILMGLPLKQISCRTEPRG